jgi:hypothetical protein
MPDYSNSMSIRQLVDLIAYLKSLTGSGDHDGHAGMGKMKMQRHAATAGLLVGVLVGFLWWGMPARRMQEDLRALQGQAAAVRQLVAEASRISLRPSID